MDNYLNTDINIHRVTNCASHQKTKTKQKKLPFKSPSQLPNIKRSSQKTQPTGQTKDLVVPLDTPSVHNHMAHNIHNQTIDIQYAVDVFGRESPALYNAV